MKPGAKAVSLIEIIVVIVIIGVAATIVFTAGYKRIFEKQRGLEGVNSLQLIFNAQKRSLLDKGAYFDCTACGPDEIMKGLGILVSSNYFNYSINTAILGDGKPGFNATATRRGGICDNKVMYLTESDSQVVKECVEWQ